MSVMFGFQGFGTGITFSIYGFRAVGLLRALGLSLYDPVGLEERVFGFFCRGVGQLPVVLQWSIRSISEFMSDPGFHITGTTGIGDITGGLIAAGVQFTHLEDADRVPA